MLYFIIFNLFLFSFSVLPYWNLRNQSSDLLENNIFEYTITHRSKNNYEVKLEKRIKKPSEGIITYENILYIEGKYKKNVEFENIESFYDYGYTYNNLKKRINVLCPMGKYNPINIETMEEIKNNDIHQNENWNLKCYYYESDNNFFIFYLNNEKNQVYDLYLINNSFYIISELQAYEEMYDFKLDRYYNLYDKNYYYQMYALCKRDGYIQFFAGNISFENPDNVRKNEINKTLIQAKKYSQAIFNNYTNDFYYFTYNNISDFSSGYSNQTVMGIDYYSINVDVVNNYTSPFEFIDEVEIKEMKFIYYTKYVYYLIYNNKTKEIYHGVLDITLNKVIFNTNEDIDVFIPYLNNSMLAITNGSAYRICFIKDNNDDCLDECSANDIIHDVDGNKCGKGCDNGKYLIIPERVCSFQCNNSIYVLNEMTCGLCRDLNSTNRYKLINGTQCLNETINGSEVYNSELYLLVCKSGYILKDNKCIQLCYETCEICSNYSIDISNQNCITCKDGYSLNNSNCVISFQNLQNFNKFQNQILNKNITFFVNSPSSSINGQDFKALIYSSKESLNKTTIGASSLDFGECPKILKSHYNIPDEENLIYLMIELDKKEINTDYNSLNIGKKTLFNIFDSSGRKLDISLCEENIKLTHNISDIIEIDLINAESFSKQNIDVFNSNDRFFNDLCHPYDNEDGKDIIIKDRINDIYQNVTFCQVGCSYKGINYDLLTANCDCKTQLMQEIFSNITKEEEKSEHDEIVNIKSLSKAFSSNLLIFNYKVITCSDLVFDLNILKNNIGFYCFLILIITQITLLVFFLYKKLTPIKSFMLNIASNNQDNNKNNPTKKKVLKKKLKSKKKKFKFDNNENSGSKKVLRLMKNKNELNQNLNQNLGDLLTTGNKTKKKKFKKLNDDSNKKIELENKINDFNNLGLNKLNKEIIKSNYIKKIINEKYSIIISNKEDDLKDMDYDDTIKNDNRTILRIYWSYFVFSQINQGTFCTENNLNLFVIKLSFLIFMFEINLFLNALFYSDDYISNAYYNNGILDFVSGLPKSIYSAIVSYAMPIILQKLSNSEKELYKVMKENYNDNNYKEIVNIKLKKLRIKLIAYYIIVFVLGILFLYFVSAFCAVYRHSQIYWFVGFLESFIIDIFISALICLIVSLFRYASIKKHNKCFHTISNVIEYFI